jgi:mono/diheme cytochrome c family protein
MLTKRNTLSLAVTLNLCLTGVISAVFAEDNDNSDAGPAKPAVDVKKVFATNCSWCHDGYGMDAGKGPKLAGTTMTEQQIRDRIVNGKSGGAMPAWGAVLKDEDIYQIGAYLETLAIEGAKWKEDLN